MIIHWALSCLSVVNLFRGLHLLHLLWKLSQGWSDLSVAFAESTERHIIPIATWCKAHRQGKQQPKKDEAGEGDTLGNNGFKEFQHQGFKKAKHTLRKDLGSP